MKASGTKALSLRNCRKEELSRAGVFEEKKKSKNHAFFAFVETK